MELNESTKAYCAPMHTAEHLLSGEIVRRYGCDRPFSTHIERKKSKVDFRLDHQPSPEELEQIEAAVNGAIARGLEVTETFLPRAEAMARYNLERLPEAAGDTVRIISVGDADACPCIGDHVAHTHKVPPIRIVSADCTDGVLRVRFKFR